MIHWQPGLVAWQWNSQLLRTFMTVNITARELNAEALKSRYYCYEKQQWQSLGWVEWLLRKFFCGFVDSPQSTCLRRSWKSIEKMPKLPTEIEKNIKGHFLDSLYHTNPSSCSFRTIFHIFCRTLAPANRIEIQQKAAKNTFEVYYNQHLSYKFIRRDYGQLIVDVNKVENDHDSLHSSNGGRIGGVKLAVDYPRQTSCMELYSGEDRLLAKVDDTKDRVNLVFRNPKTNHILAVSELSRSDDLINWNITLIDDKVLQKKHITPLLLAWTVLKYSQHYHFV